MVRSRPCEDDKVCLVTAWLLNYEFDDLPPALEAKKSGAVELQTTTCCERDRSGAEAEHCAVAAVQCLRATSLRMLSGCVDALDASFIFVCSVVVHLRSISSCTMRNSTKYLGEWVQPQSSLTLRASCLL